MKKEVKDIMGGKFRAITQVSCILLLALSLSLVTAVSVMAVEFPSILPETAEYDLDDPAEVMTTITWGNASSIQWIKDDYDYYLVKGLNRDYIGPPDLEKHLIILNSYLAGKLTDIGDEVELIIQFDVGAVVFTIEAIGTQPTISPKTAEYDLEDPTNVETTITWGIAAYVDSISENGNFLTGGDYTVGATVGGEATLTILNGYLASELNDIGDNVGLTIEFDVGDPVAFNITATGTPPTILPTTAEYDVEERPNVETTITWGAADHVDSISENGNVLTGGDYTVGATVGGESTLTILDGYLAGELTDIGESIVLTIEFDRGEDATFTITATGSNPTVSPPTAEYNLDAPIDVKTTIKWGDADYVDSISENGNVLTGGDYTVGATVGGEATLTILNGYLASELIDIGDKVVLTIEFDLGEDATFTITATGIRPVLSTQTEEYNLDKRKNVETTITWGTAKSVVSIVDDDEYPLVLGSHYTVTDIDPGVSASLTILSSPYLEDKLTDIDESVALTIEFDVDTATFTITASGTHPSIDPPTAEYDIIDQYDVITTITWGTATSVVSIVDDDEFILAEGMHYTVTDNATGMPANLTILSSTYLADKLESFGEDLVLTIGFDVGRDATLTINVPEICFIATAAYGTPMAEEIQILREFRDEYLLTNPLGQTLVDLYYRVSPPIAEFITKHPSLKPIVRAGLVPAVVMSTIAVNTTLVEKIAIVGLLVLVSVALAVWAIRRRGRGPEYT